MKGIDETYEYAFFAVPAEKRKATGSLVYIMTGFALSSSGLTMGALIGGKMTFLAAAGTCILGNLLLAGLALFWGILGSRQGESSVYLVKKYLGNKLAVVFASLLIFFMILYIGVSGELLARSVISIFPGWPLPLSVTVLLLLGIVTFCSLNGWRSMELLSRIFVPLILILTIHNMVYGLLQKDSIENIVNYQPEVYLTVPAAIVVIGSNFSLFSVTMADICRFAKNDRAVRSCIAAYILALTASNLCGILIVQATGAKTLEYGIYLLRMQGWGFLWLLLCAYTTQNVNMYIGSLAIQKLIHRTVLGGNVSHKTAVVFIGGLAIIIGVLGLSPYMMKLTGWVFLLLMLLSGVVAAKVFQNKRKNAGRVE